MDIFERFFDAVSSGDIQSVQSLLDNSNIRDLINRQDHTGMTPLFWSINNNINIEIVKLLLINGARNSINTPNNEGDTPLNWVVYIDNIYLVNLLLKNGAYDSINDPNNDGMTPLHTAIQNNNIQIITLLLANGANINMPDNEGKTPLFLAVAENNIEIVKLLLDRGARESINTPDNYGFTPLYSAINNNYIKMIKLLVYNGAIINNVIMDHIKNLTVNPKIIRLLDILKDYRFNPIGYTYLPTQVKDSIRLLMTIRLLNDTLIILPNELLFELFYFLTKVG